jgi:hypothetical protein
MGIEVTEYALNLIAVNIVISGLEADVRCLNGSVFESKTRISTNVRNIGSINSTLESINKRITRFDAREQCWKVGLIIQEICLL